MVNPIKSFKDSLGKVPTKYRFWTSLAILAALLIALPITLIGLMTGTFELRKRAVTAEPSPAPATCICQPDVDNFCLYAPSTPNCPMTEPGGYCDPNGNGDYNDADWERGYYEYLGRCLGGPTPAPGLASCGQSCGDDQDCQEGLLCGTPCPEGQMCAQYLWCYNPSCPYDRDCICGASPTPVPCGQEGETIPVYPGYQCCPGLEPISPNKPDANGNCPDYPLLGALVCVKDCGDGQCTLGENKCNCPEDCVHNSLRIKLRFGGVTSRPPDDSNKEVQIYATNLTGGPNLGSATDKKLITLEVDDSGVYHGEITPTSTYFGHRYRLRIKGPKHLQSVFPDVFFQAGGELDLTEWPLRPGDLNQDGKVDINDLRAVKVFSPDPVDIAVGDVNFDGRVSILDRTLVLNTLSVQYDPE